LAIRAFLYSTPGGRYHPTVFWESSKFLDVSGAFQVALLWAHAMAAVAWVGGSLFYAAVLNPALSEVGPTPERLSLVGVAGREFREVVRLAIVVFVVTGAVLAFTRMSQPRVPAAYVAVLTVKVVLSLWMFWLAGRIGRAPPAGAKPRPWWQRPQYLILGLGALVYLLSLALRVIYEAALGVPL
jgi:uncharacterized membrane protein